VKRLLEDRGVQNRWNGAEAVVAARCAGGREAGGALRNTDQSAGRLGETGEQNQPEPAHEMLLRTAARQDGAWTTPEDLGELFDAFYTLAGIPSGDVVQTDGSGLSRHDLVTPRALVALLLYAQKQPWFEVYFASLPVAGIDGTLEDRMKNSIADGRLHAKSGSVEHVRTRSGYAICPTGGGLVFSFLSNNMGSKGMRLRMRWMH